MDCSACHYPNEEEVQYCVRCAAPMGVRPTQLPAGAPQPSPQASAFVGPGSLLGGKYRLLRALGSGGFGAVYEAEQLPLGTRVAIKLLNEPSLQDARIRERFLNEARMVAQLRSPHVVVLHDFAVTPTGVPYLVMEYLRGQDLGRLLCQGVLAPRRAVHIAAQVCAALGEAHGAGILHRDVKPENVVLLPRDYDPDFVKIVDFGVAKFLQGADRRASAVLGTPAYIAPEMLAGEPLDGRSDLYALGIMLWEMIVGRLPFPGRNQAEMLQSHLHAPRRRPRELAAELALPEPLEALLVQVVARKAGERPRTAFELRTQLLAVRSLCPERPLEVPPPVGGPPWDPPPPPAKA